MQCIGGGRHDKWVVQSQRRKSMNDRIEIPGVLTPRVTPESTTLTRVLLACGVVAGPLFTVVALLLVFTRDGFDLSRHPLSLLSLGEWGWIQIGNFVVTGLLVVACAVGLRRVMHPGRAGTWGPLLVGSFGMGMVAGGVFVTDAGAGFPPGAPAGTPEQLSWHAIAHSVGAALSFVALIAACFVVARRFSDEGQRGLAAYCLATGLALLGIMAWPDKDTVSVQLAVAVVLGLGWVAALAVRLLSRLPS
jgi:hypothetical protein